MMLSEAKTPLSFLFNIVAQYIQILCTFNFMFVALTTRRSVLPLAVSELFINWMCHRGFPSSTYLTQVYDNTD